MDGSGHASSRAQVLSSEADEETEHAAHPRPMSPTASISASMCSLQQLQDSGTWKPNGQGQYALDDIDDWTTPENVPLPESTSFAASNPRPNFGDSLAQSTTKPERMDGSSREETSVPTAHGEDFEDEHEELKMPREVEPQPLGSSIRDNLRSGLIDFESLLSATYDILDENGCNLLHIAVDSGQYHAVASLLARDTSMEARDAQGLTALHHAISRADMSIVRLLVEHGADMEAVTNEGARPLWMAVNLGKENAVRCLLDYDADIESFNPFTETTALFEAVKRGDVLVAQMLLENGADVDARTAAAASAPTPPLPQRLPRLPGWQEVHIPSSYTSSIKVKPEKRSVSGSMVAWMRGFHSSNKSANMDEYRRTQQWAGNNVLGELSPYASSEGALETVDYGQGTTLLPPPAKDPPVTSSGSPNKGNDEKTPREEGLDGMLKIPWQDKTSELKGNERHQEEVMHAKEDVPQAVENQEDVTLYGEEVEARRREEVEKNEESPHMKHEEEQYPNNAASAGPQIFPLPNAIHFHDCVGRKFIFSFELAKHWHVSGHPA